MDIKPLLKEIKDNSSKALWSQAVQMSRSTKFLMNTQALDSITLQLHVPGQTIHPTVELWPEDIDWRCSCSLKEDPCVHAVASAIYLNHKDTKKTNQNSDTIYRLEYHLKKQDHSLYLYRYLNDGKERAPLKGNLMQLISKSQPPIATTSADLQIDRQIKEQKESDSGYLLLTSLLPYLKQAPLVLFEEVLIKTQTQSLKRQAIIRSYKKGLNLSFHLPPLETEDTLFKNHFVIKNNELFSLQPPLFPKSWNFNLQTDNFIPEDRIKEFTLNVLPKLNTSTDLINKSLALPQISKTPPYIELYFQKHNNGDLVVTPRLFYGSPVIAQKLNQELHYIQKQYVIVENKDEELKIKRKLRDELQLQIDRPVTFNGSDAIEFTQKSETWLRQGQENLYQLKETMIPSTSFESGLLSVQFNHQNTSVSFNQALEQWQNGSNHIQLLSGQWMKLPTQWLEKYADKISHLLATQNNKDTLPKSSFPEFISLADELQIPYPSTVSTFKKLLKDFKHLPTFNLPFDLKADLRPYQKEGINWLAFLQKHSLGAMLADDMGLGKTLQTIAVLKGRCLVICPTSVLDNWKNEIQKFRPNLSISIYHGSQREISNESDITITSYGVLRLDINSLSSITWDAIVLDESQTIKNYNSQIARATYQLKGHFRIALSGTPVENKLQDLYSQFRFVLPDLFGSIEYFSQQFEKPIQEQKNHALQKLRQTIAPFFLRRLKTNVLKDLPPKTEITLHCELSEKERDLYSSLLASTHKEIIQKLDEGQNLFSILELLLRLRQACCHSSLVPKQEVLPSAKLELLITKIKDSINLNHKSLVFSQWTKFLDVIEDRLKKENISFCRLDGKTQKRSDVVDNFQSDNGPSTMLISLKAGGVGITLTKADHIYIMDPWWNPAVEEQAADRAYRIGQQNPVFVHKLVAKNTIEEKIIQLQNKKQQLSKSLMEGSGQVSITKEDILFLLQ